MSNARVRFAPSPTGYLHVGGARTALFNWLFARHHGGTFVLRIEDTDVERSTPEAVQAILDGMRWLGLNWDEGPEVGGPHGPYCQMQRLDLYREHARRLEEGGHAYPCFCTPAELESRRKQAAMMGRPPGYDRRCRDLTADQVAEKRDQGLASVLRLRVPLSGETVVDDLIHGQVTFANDTLDDFVLVRADGIPTFHFAVVVDDATMRITHVLRGDDHLSNTPKHVLIFQALGISPPRFGHIPMILGPDKTKLSKRHGATSVMAYEEAGLLSDAMVNFLARLGWAHGDDEIMSREQLVSWFDLDGVNKTAAVFDHDKLEWLNAQYLKNATPAALLPWVKQRWQDRAWLSASDTDDRLCAIIAALQERSRTLVQLVDQSAYFFDAPLAWDPEAERKFLAVEHREILGALKARIEALRDWSLPALEEAIRGLATERGMKAGQVIQPARVALTGRTVSPGIFEVVHLMGKERTIRRLAEAIARTPTAIGG